MDRNNRNAEQNMGSFNVFECENENIAHFQGYGARIILLDLPIEGIGFSHVAIEKNKLKIFTQRLDYIEEDSLPLPGRVIDKLHFLRTDIEKNESFCAGFIFLIYKKSESKYNTCLVVSIRMENMCKWRLERLCAIPTECSKIAHVFLDQWQVPKKIMLMHPSKDSFDFISIEGSDCGTFDFETECLLDRNISVEKSFLVGTRSGCSRWSLENNDLKFDTDLPLKIDYEKAFAQKSRCTPQVPDDQVFYTGTSVYFLYNGKTVDIEDAKDILGYNFVITGKGLYFIDGWPDDELVLRHITQKSLKPLLFDGTEREETPFRAFFIDEETNELIVFCESERLMLTNISGIRGRILDVSVSLESNSVMIYTMEETVEISDFSMIPSIPVEFI